MPQWPIRGSQNGRKRTTFESGVHHSPWDGSQLCDKPLKGDEHMSQHELGCNPTKIEMSESFNLCHRGTATSRYINRTNALQSPEGSKNVRC